MDTIKVVCGLIFLNGSILLCRRKPNDSLGGFWEFPGGKVEIGERYENALKRELFEELGIKIIIKEHFKTVKHDYNAFTIELISFICDFIDSNILMKDHDSFIWIKIPEIRRLNLAPADIPIADELIKEKSIQNRTSSNSSCNTFFL